jgi:aminoglycoside 2'-N-acetyltransferase I
MMTDNKNDITLRVVPGKDLTSQEREAVVALCDLAYEEDMETIINQFVDPMHVLGVLEGKMVCHALWITRYLQPEGLPLMRTAYLEAVATHPDCRHRGFASEIMRKVVEEIQDFDIAGLAPFSEDYYARLGWELWRGTLFERTEDGLVISPPEERVMIYRLPKTPALDLDSPISVEWRVGEVW